MLFGHCISFAGTLANRNTFKKSSVCPYFCIPCSIHLKKVVSVPTFQARSQTGIHLKKVVSVPTFNLRVLDLNIVGNVSL